jgi:hypothetical protein
MPSIEWMIARKSHLKFNIMTNKELNQAIRKDLKNNGITSKDVSVRVRYAMYDTAVDVTVKNIHLDIEQIEKICNKYEKIRYCQASGEILSGCNIYVCTRYDYSTISDFIETKYKQAETIYNKTLLNLEPSCGVKIAENGNKELYFFRGSSQYWLHQAVVKDNGIYLSDKIDFNNHFGLAKALAYFELHGKF